MVPWTPCPLPCLRALVGRCACAAAAPATYCGGLEGREERPFFAAAGDLQRTGLVEFWREQNDEARQAVIERIAREDPAFLLLLGDLVFFGGSPRHWKWFDDFLAPVREREIPCFPVPGNHDYFGRRSNALRRFHRRFPCLEGRTWGRVSFRRAAILLLDSNFGRLPRAAREAQARWFKETLAACDADPEVSHVVVAAHHPPFTNSRVVKGRPETREAFAEPFLRAAKTRLFLSGHAHAYERFERDGRRFVVAGGGGGPRQRVETRPGRRRYADAFEGGPLRPFHYVKIFPGGSELRVQMVAADGDLRRWSVQDEF